MQIGGYRHAQRLRVVVQVACPGHDGKMSVARLFQQRQVNVTCQQQVIGVVALTSGGGQRPEELSDRLHAARGLDSVRSRGDLGYPRDIDLPDVHTGDARTHRRTHRSIRWLGRELPALFG